jgi:hypothetical protein
MVRRIVMNDDLGNARQRNCGIRKGQQHRRSNPVHEAWQGQLFPQESPDDRRLVTEWNEDLHARLNGRPNLLGDAWRCDDHDRPAKRSSESRHLVDEIRKAAARGETKSVHE